MWPCLPLCFYRERVRGGSFTSSHHGHVCRSLSSIDSLQLLVCTHNCCLPHPHPHCGVEEDVQLSFWDGWED